MIRTQLYLPETLYSDIKRRARADGKPAAQLIRDTLERGFSEQAAAKPLESWAVMTKRLNIRGGPKDLSRRIDDYLYDDE